MFGRTLFSLCVLALVAALAPAAASAAPVRSIVVFKAGVSNPGSVADQHRARHGAQLRHVYKDALKGYAAKIPSARLAALRSDKRVAYVEHDGAVRAVGQILPWGVNRVDADTSTTLAGDGSGAISNMHAFVVDTGIYKHSDLNVVNHVDYADGPNTDCDGHGTHVAGTLAARDNASAVVGVAPGIRLTGVKVLDCEGSGLRSDVIAGVDYVTRRAPYTRGPDVANVSLGTGPSQSIDDAVRRSAASGIFYAVAAGNDGANACYTSPARAGAGTNNGIATVAATDGYDGETPSSNFGSCVDIWAPGASILSTRKGGGTTRASGTSMASPHVAGGGALYRSRHAATARDIETKLTASAEFPGTRSKNGRLIRRLFVGGAAGF